MSNQPFNEAWLTGPKATQFYTRTYIPSDTSVPTKAAVVFVHGFAEHIGRYAHFHTLLTARGIAVFAYDQRGFGLTGQDTTGKKSKTSTYGKTSWKDQMMDIDWALAHAKKSFESVPIFLMGHSMGGGEVLGFSTQGEKGSYKASLGLISGVIATSPLILTTSPPPKFGTWIGSKLSTLLPSTLIPVGVKAEDLSHDPEVNNAYLKDPLVKQSGSLKGVSDMLTYGEKVLQSEYVKWPKTLPLLIVHGTEDKVTSHKASQSLHSKLQANNKKLSIFEGGFHELQNEPNGVKEKLADEIIAFIEEHLTTPSAASPVNPAETIQSSETATESAPAPPTETTTEPTGDSLYLWSEGTGRSALKDQEGTRNAKCVKYSDIPAYSVLGLRRLQSPNVENLYNSHPSNVYIASLRNHPCRVHGNLTPKAGSQALALLNSTREYIHLDLNTPKPKAVIVFLHRFAEHIGRYLHIQPLFVARGIAVFTYDQRGFGLTALDTTGKKSQSSTYGKTSWTDQMADIDWAQKFAGKTFQDVLLFLMGHSMGGTEVLGYPTQGQNGVHNSMLNSLSGVISTSPLILQTTLLPKTTIWLIGILSALLLYTVVPVPGKLEDLSHDPVVSSGYQSDPLLKQTGTLRGFSDLISQGERLLHYDYINWPRTIPVLIVHGTGDKVTSHTASQSFHDKLTAQSKKISLFMGGFHELHNEPDGVKEKLVDEVVAFIEEHLP